MRAFVLPLLLTTLLLPSLILAACQEEEATPAATPSLRATVAVTPAATPSPVPGVTDSEIVLGQHAIITGALGAAYAMIPQAEQAYFKYVNETQGGVCGRKIVLKVEDSGNDSAQGLAVTRKLVEQDQVFAMFASQGVVPHSAVWEYLNEKGVPDLFIIDGSLKFGSDPEKYPWSVAYIPPYFGEGTVFARYISENLSGKKVGVLYQNDDFGQEGLAGLKKGLDRQKNPLVAAESYETTDVDIRSQVMNIYSAGAEVVVLYSIPGFTAQAIKKADHMGWHPQFFINYSNSDPIIYQLVPPQLMEGVITFQGMKLPDWTEDPAVAEHHEIMRKYGGPTPSNFSLVGHAAAELMVEALSRTCDNLTREGLMDAVESFRDYQGRFSLEGITVTITDSDHWASDTLRMLRSTLKDGKGQWEYFGPLIPFR